MFKHIFSTEILFCQVFRVLKGCYIGEFWLYKTVYIKLIKKKTKVVYKPVLFSPVQLDSKITISLKGFTQTQFWGSVFVCGNDLNLTKLLWVRCKFELNRSFGQVWFSYWDFHFLRNQSKGKGQQVYHLIHWFRPEQTNYTFENAIRMSSSTWYQLMMLLYLLLLL